MLGCLDFFFSNIQQFAHLLICGLAWLQKTGWDGDAIERGYKGPSALQERDSDHKKPITPSPISLDAFSKQILTVMTERKHG
jgi:hypothetical protein